MSLDQPIKTRAPRACGPLVLYSCVLHVVSLSCLRRILGILWRASCGMGNFRQIRGLYRTAQFVLIPKWTISTLVHCRDLRRNHSCCSAAVGMADADRGAAKWSVSSLV